MYKSDAVASKSEIQISTNPSIQSESFPTFLFKMFQKVIILVTFILHLTFATIIEHNHEIPHPSILAAGLNDSEVTIYLNSIFETLQLPESDIPSLRNLQVGLYRNKITQLFDIPNDKQGVMSLLRGITLDPTSLILLEKGLSVKLPELDTSLLTGYGYNFKTDSILPLSPFNLTSKKLSSIGFIIPKIYTLDVINEMKEVFILYKSTEQYLQSRFSFKESSVSQTTITRSCFWFWCWTTSSKTHTGYNKEVSQTSSETNQTVEEISNAQEQRLFQLHLSPEDLIPSEEFKRRVNELTKFNQDTCASQSLWKNFFDDYGTHVVSSAFGGGSLDISLRGNHMYEILSDSFEKYGKDVTVMNYFHASSTEELKTENNSSVYMTNIYKSTSFRAGDSKFQKTDFFNIEESEKREIIEEWKNSIPQNPIMLDSNLELTSILDYIELVNPDLRDTLNFQSAMNYWLSGNLRSCEWYSQKFRPVTIYYDEFPPGLRWDHRVQILDLAGGISGPPVYLSSLESQNRFLCSEEEKCLVVTAQANCGNTTFCGEQFFHIHYDTQSGLGQELKNP